MIKLLVSDIDGVWTDGSFYYSPLGDVMRVFSVSDGFGVKMARLARKDILILSGENCQMVEKRMEKLGISNFVLGVDNKLEILKRFCIENNFDLQEVAYLGDDLNDYPISKYVGLFCCPSDAHEMIKTKSTKVLTTKGGKGVFREFVRYTLELEGAYEEILGAVIGSYEQ